MSPGRRALCTCTRSTASFAPCDLSTAGGAAALAVALQERGRIDLLVNAAGSLGGSAAETLTINAIAPAVLTIGLMQSLAASPSPRVVNVASSAHLRARYVEPTLLRRSLARDVGRFPPQRSSSSESF